MGDTLAIKEDDVRKKDEFGNRLVSELEKTKKKLNAVNTKLQLSVKDQNYQIAGISFDILGLMSHCRG